MPQRLCYNASAALHPIKKLDLRQGRVVNCLFLPCFKASETTAITSWSAARANGAGQGLHVHGAVAQ